MKMVCGIVLFFNLSVSLNLLNADQSAEEIFTYIYDKGVWGCNEEGLGSSGTGSTVQNTEPYMKFLQNFLIENKITSVVDVGCGDWTFSQHIDWGNIHYTGYDVVKHVIERNQIKFSSPTIQFIHADISLIAFPSADLLICKDVLQHLPLKDISLFLKQIHKFRYCLITNDVDSDTLTSYNSECPRGAYRSLDLTNAPFNVQGTKLLNFLSYNVMKQVLLIENPNY
jgi:SAM-dependent methyltransferase